MYAYIKNIESNIGLYYSEGCSLSLAGVISGDDVLLIIAIAVCLKITPGIAQMVILVSNIEQHLLESSHIIAR